MIRNGPNWDQLLSSVSDGNDMILDIYPNIDNTIIPEAVIDSAITRYNIDTDYLSKFFQVNMPADAFFSLSGSRSDQINTLKSLFQQLINNGPYISSRPELNIPELKYNPTPFGIKLVLSRLAWIILFISRRFNENDRYKLLWILHRILATNIRQEIKRYYQVLFIIIVDVIPNSKVMNIIGRIINETGLITNFKLISKIASSDPITFAQSIIQYGLNNNEKTPDYILAVNGFQQGIDAIFRKKYKLTTDKVSDVRFRFKFSMRSKPEDEDIKNKEKFMSSDLSLYWSIDPGMTLYIPKDILPSLSYIKNAGNASRATANKTLMSNLRNDKDNAGILYISRSNVNFSTGLIKMFAFPSVYYDTDTKLVTEYPNGQYNFIHNIMIPLMMEYPKTMFDIKARSAVDFLCTIFSQILVLDQPNLIEGYIYCGLYNIILHDLAVIENNLRIQAIGQEIDKKHIISSFVEFFNKITDAIIDKITDDNQYTIQQIYKTYHRILDLLTQSNIKSLAEITDSKMRKKRFDDFQKWMVRIFRYDKKDKVHEIFETDNLDKSLTEYMDRFRKFLVENIESKFINPFPVLDQIHQLIIHIILSGMYNITTLSAIYNALYVISEIRGRSLINTSSSMLTEVLSGIQTTL